ncbi:hypothetical protein ASQ43_08605 [Parasaccharibacter apium]|nr:hypothetical protein ASQ43_08605 [Parasaccharibacter apium]
MTYFLYQENARRAWCDALTGWRWPHHDTEAYGVFLPVMLPAAFLVHNRVVVKTFFQLLWAGRISGMSGGKIWTFSGTED